jgi:hypothetical protein
MNQPEAGRQCRKPRRLRTTFRRRLGIAETRLKMRTPGTLEKSVNGISASWVPRVSGM